MPFFDYKRYQSGLSNKYNGSYHNNRLKVSVSAKRIEDYYNCIYKITDKHTGMFYIGKAKKLRPRVNTHIQNILYNINLLLLGNKDIMYSNKSLDCHKQFAALFVQNEKLNLSIVVIKSFGKSKGLVNVTKEETLVIRKYISKYKEKMFNCNSQAIIKNITHQSLT
jgi:hypothetical protein